MCAISNLKYLSVKLIIFLLMHMLEPFLKLLYVGHQKVMKCLAVWRIMDNCYGFLQWQYQWPINIPSKTRSEGWTLLQCEAELQWTCQLLACVCSPSVALSLGSAATVHIHISYMNNLHWKVLSSCLPSVRCCFMLLMLTTLINCCF